MLQCVMKYQAITVSKVGWGVIEKHIKLMLEEMLITEQIYVFLTRLEYSVRDSFCGNIKIKGFKQNRRRGKNHLETPDSKLSFLVACFSSAI